LRHVGILPRVLRETGAEIMAIIVKISLYQNIDKLSIRSYNERSDPGNLDTQLSISCL
jgi:hypothetical protein